MTSFPRLTARENAVRCCSTVPPSWDLSQIGSPNLSRNSLQSSAVQHQCNMPGTRKNEKLIKCAAVVVKNKTDF